MAHLPILLPIAISLMTVGWASDEGSISFKEPVFRKYQSVLSQAASGADQGQTLTLQATDGARETVQFTTRVFLRLKPGVDLAALLQPGELVDRVLGEAAFILQCPTAAAAVACAQRFSALDDVFSAVPIRVSPVSRNFAYAKKPDDPRFPDQWHLENRDASGRSKGVDLNVRSAWPMARGAGVVIAICDDGVQTTHPDFATRFSTGLNRNFLTGAPSGDPTEVGSSHGTCVAGLAAASGGNGIGVSGAAPEASLTSWILLSDFLSPTDEQEMDLFQNASNLVSIQNHSWGPFGDIGQVPYSAPQEAGIAAAVKNGRGGLGVVMVRAGGNGRYGRNVNDEAFSNDYRIIPVGAVRKDGRVASYSSRGAALLVAAPSDDFDEGFDGIVTTDRTGADGFNDTDEVGTDSADYVFGFNAFGGTSAASPQIAGVAALILSVRPDLAVRDVQQILLLSSRHFDLADPDLRTNSAGLRVSHNLGYGIPDAGEAVRLARLWKSRPSAQVWTSTVPASVSIPEQPLLSIAGPAQLDISLSSRPSLRPAYDTNQLAFPLKYVGLGGATNLSSLQGAAALIERGTSTFQEKIQSAARNGAAFAVIFDNVAGPLITMLSTDFTPIPAVFISRADGANLLQRLANGEALTAGLWANPEDRAARFVFDVPATLQCEHVSVSLKMTHPNRGQLRIVLVSPSGTRSLLQELNSDSSATVTDWTWHSTHHFFESSHGAWQVLVVDQQGGVTGSIAQVGLTIRGASINDTDHDGLDDDWERASFGSLSAMPKDDPDLDGHSNLVESLVGTNPLAAEDPLRIRADELDDEHIRLSWSGSQGKAHELLESTDLNKPAAVLKAITGAPHENEAILLRPTQGEHFYSVRVQP